MTDRVNAFIVVLEHDIREDELHPTLLALQQIKGVVQVIPHVPTMESAIAETRARRDLWEKVFRVFEDDTKP